MPSMALKRRTRALNVPGRAIALAGASAIALSGHGCVWAQGHSITEHIAYHDNPRHWVLGQVARIECVASSQSGCTPSTPVLERSFDPDNALPLSHKAHGLLQQTLGYDTASTVASGQRGTLKTVADGNGNTTTLSSWHRGVPRSIKYADTASESAEVNAQGWITKVTDPLGNATGYTYDPLGRLTSITPPTGFSATTLSFAAATSAAYGLPAGHWQHTVTQGQAKTVTYYDALWRAVMTRSFDATSSATEAATRKVIVKAYDPEGRITFESSPQRELASVAITGPGRRTQYDALGRPIRQAIDSELGELVTTTEYLADFQTRITNPRGKATTQGFWALNDPAQALLASLALPEGVSVSIERDAFGKPTQISRGGITRRYVYDAGQRLCKTLEPELIATVQDHDAAGNLAWRAPGVNLPNASCDTASVSAAAKIFHSYDKRNRLTRTSYGDASPAVSRGYWADGKLKTLNSNGAVWDYGYNALRQPTTETLAYGGKTYTLTRSYNANGHLASLSYPTGGPSLSYAPNALGQPTQVGSYASSISFHPSGAVAGYTLGNGVAHSLTLNERQLPKTLQDGALLKNELRYDANGNVTGITDPQQPATDRAMAYDGLDRLSSASGVWGTASYGYDAADNLTSAQVGSRSHTLGYDTRNRLVSLSGTSSVAYAYDARGNISQRGSSSYQFDLGNRLQMVNGINAYTYDGHGRRVKHLSSDGSTRIHLYSQDGQLLWSTSSGGTRAASSTAYLHLGGKQIAEWNSVSGVQYLHTDALGSPVARSGSTGALISRTHYEPYGGIVPGSTPPGPQAGSGLTGYTGHVQDPETGLVYMQQRYYEPVAGRFLSVDPVVTDANTGRSFGRYHYANNNPYKFTDPDGRLPIIPLIGLGLAINELANGDGPPTPGGGLAKQGVKAVERAIAKEGGEKAVEGAGRAANKLRPVEGAEGAHSTFKRGPDGKITNTATYKENPKNPSGFDEVKRVDVSGKVHTNPDGTVVPTPHVKEAGTKGVRPAEPKDLPKQ